MYRPETIDYYVPQISDITDELVDHMETLVDENQELPK